MNRLPAERIEAVIARLDAGDSDRAAARAVGVDRRTAARYRAIWRRSRARALPEDPAGPIVAQPRAATAAALAAEAARRGLRRAELVAEILDQAVASGLIGIILGDDERVRGLAAAAAGAH